MPAISIIIPVYNAENTIRGTIDSVLSQSFVDFEAIIIDDGSTDSCKEILKEYAEKDQRIKLFFNPENLGVAKTRNIAIARAEGKWIAFVDADDMWTKDKLEKQIAFMEEKNAIIGYTSTSFIDPDGNKFGYIMEAEDTIDYKTLLKRNIITCSSAMVLAEEMKKVLMPSDAMHEDYYVWLEILKKEKYAYGLKEPLTIYRMSRHSKSSNRLKSAKMSYNTYRAVGYNPITTLFRMLVYTKHSVSKRTNIYNSALPKES